MSVYGNKRLITSIPLPPRCPPDDPATGSAPGALPALDGLIGGDFDPAAADLHLRLHLCGLRNADLCGRHGGGIL